MSCCIKQVIYGSSLKEVIYKDKEELDISCPRMINISFEEPIDSGYFKNKGEIWFNQESGGYVGYPIYVPDPFAEQGGGYFNQ